MKFDKLLRLSGSQDKPVVASFLNMFQLIQERNPGKENLQKGKREDREKMVNREVFRKEKWSTGEKGTGFKKAKAKQELKTKRKAEKT